MNYCIVDYSFNEHPMTIEYHNSVVKDRLSLRQYTDGWFICIQWKDELTSLEKLSDMNECYPVETEEYTVARGINHEPDYNWWVGHVMCKRDFIILDMKKSNAKYLKHTHNFGIEVPKTVAEDIYLYENNGDTPCKDEIAKEMKNVREAFKILAESGKPPPGYQKIRCHMIFDIKMEDSRCKERVVVGVHVTDPPDTITYASVALRETVRVALTVVALNDFQVRKADIHNSYIQAPVAKKIWSVSSEAIITKH